MADGFLSGPLGWGAAAQGAGRALNAMQGRSAAGGTPVRSSERRTLPASAGPACGGASRDARSQPGTANERSAGGSSSAPRTDADARRSRSRTSCEAGAAERRCCSDPRPRGGAERARARRNRSVTALSTERKAAVGAESSSVATRMNAERAETPMTTGHEHLLRLPFAPSEETGNRRGIRQSEGVSATKRTQERDRHGFRISTP